MADDSSDDWLPTGWTVDVRVKRSGRKDRLYTSPDGLRFSSKVEVLRYLKTARCNSPQSKEEKNVILEQSVGGACDGIAHINSFPSKEDKKVHPDQFDKNCYDHIVGNSPPLSKEEQKICLENSSKHFLCNAVVSGSPTFKGEKIVCGGAVDSCTLVPEGQKVDLDGPMKMVCSASAEKHSTLTREEDKSSHQQSPGDVCSDPRWIRSSTFKEQKIFSLEESAKEAHENKIESTYPSLRQKNRARHQQPTVNVAVEKAVAEGLPEGWTKEIKVKRKNGTIVRRDPYYTDPVSGYVFRSMKDVRRYLQTGDIGRLAYKPPDKDEIDADLEDSKITSPVPKKQKFSVAETESTDDLGLQHCERVTDNHMSTSDHPEEGVPIPEYAVGSEGTNFSISRLSNAEGLEQNQEKSTCSEKDLPVPEGRALSEEHPQNMVKAEGNKEREVSNQKSQKKKKEIDVPRRASKRLAGIAVDPTVEITTVRANRGPAHVNQEEASQAKGTTSGSGIPPAPQSMDQLGPQQDTKCTGKPEEAKDPSKAVAACKEDPEDSEGNKEDDNKKQGGTQPLQQESLSIASAHPANVESIHKSEEKPVLPFDLPSQDILSDPCIEFAIKTLTGISFDTPTENALEFSKSRNSFGDLAHPNVHGENMETEKEDNEKQGSGAVLPLQKLAQPEKHAGKVSAEENAGDVPGSSLNLPFGDSWADPCIEFAIKTLTGAIPVEYGLDVHDLIQQQMRSSQMQEASDLNLSNAGLDNFCRTDLLWQHSDTAVKPVCRPQAGLVPAAPHTGNVDFQRSSGSVRRQHRQDRGNIRQR
ncbi:methyl-CpG-binding domain-containing protein 13 isoform X2 [Rhodamnia argentea]|uniref:Methyl-CpG-binding domain-containing protein 13 isoform X2 n=1 Tax=Rhodamnia argentea TaxID=178133 RepID=A0A8B8PPA3_9MYRT|nr:methyl-CpG-binding domain-containing protein 13 isoform X2 [Rhodamnia argentea]